MSTNWRRRQRRLHPLHRAHELARDAGLAHRVAGVGHHDVLGLRPGAREGVGGDRRAHDVVAALHDRAGQVADARHAGEQLAFGAGSAACTK